MRIILALVAMAFLFVPDADARGMRSRGRMVQRSSGVMRSGPMQRSAPVQKATVRQRGGC